jgi:hypothetical protein
MLGQYGLDITDPQEGSTSSQPSFVQSFRRLLAMRSERPKTDRPGQVVEAT